jgi:uncharacterized lipoprotein YddW (UPF0748 family)
MKLFKYKSSEPIFYYNTDKQVEIPEEYNQKPIRGIWVSNVRNIDLPTLLDIEEYKKQVLRMLDVCLDYSINTIFFQVRTTNDAFYLSKLNPTSRFLVGKEGDKLPFDVFAWIIDEARKRDIDVHAWCNPYRVSFDGTMSKEEYFRTCDDMNFAKKYPEFLVLDKRNQMILNPAKKEVKEFIIASMVEIVENYQVAGIHFDDYFYPYSGLSETENDDFDFSNQKLDLADFRRKNVNDVIEGVYKAIKKVDEKLVFGVSPFGIWKNKLPNQEGSNTDLACTEGYHSLYADALAWVKGEYIDYLVPQIYWEFGHKIAPFADICDFWVDACKDYPVKLYIGHGAYRLGNEGEFENIHEITNQVKYANQFDKVQGNIFFTYHNFIDEGKGFLGMQELKKLLNGEIR